MPKLLAGYGPKISTTGAKISTTGSVYDTVAWKRLRRLTRRRDDYRCVVCGADVSAKGAARSDHIKSVRTHPELALDPRNVRTLCVRCDNQAHREKPRGPGAAREERFEVRGCDIDGWPV